MFNLASWGNFKAMVVSFLGLLLTFVDDMSDRWKYGRASRMSQQSPLTCGTETGLRPNVLTDFTDDGWNFPLICRRACG